VIVSQQDPEVVGGNDGLLQESLNILQGKSLLVIQPGTLVRFFMPQKHTWSNQ